MALSNPWDLKTNLVSNWERTRREERRGEEEEEGGFKPRSSQKGMETTLSMYFVWITWNLRLDMVNILSLNLGF